MIEKLSTRIKQMEVFVDRKIDQDKCRRMMTEMAIDELIDYVNKFESCRQSAYDELLAVKREELN